MQSCPILLQNKIVGTGKLNRDDLIIDNIEYF